MQAYMLSSLRIAVCLTLSLQRASKERALLILHAYILSMHAHCPALICSGRCLKICLDICVGGNAHPGTMGKVELPQSLVI